MTHTWTSFCTYLNWSTKWQIKKEIFNSEYKFLWQKNTLWTHWTNIWRLSCWIGSGWLFLTLIVNISANRVWRIKLFLIVDLLWSKYQLSSSEISGMFCPHQRTGGKPSMSTLHLPVGEFACFMSTCGRNHHHLSAPAPGFSHATFLQHQRTPCTGINAYNSTHVNRKKIYVILIKIQSLEMYARCKESGGLGLSMVLSPYCYL